MRKTKSGWSTRAAARWLVVACVVLLVAVASPAFARPAFDPAHVLSDSVLRDADSMTEAQVQAFLERHPGVLKSLVTADHDGVSKRASAIIYEACRAWNISPRVMLALLQKENSLISNPSPSQRVLSRAIGAGCPNSVDNRYPGFGNQIWNGARMLDGYGEGKTTSYIANWKPGTVCKVSEGSVTPKNLATFKLYTYNPTIGADAPYGDLLAQAGSLHGQASFWHVYWRYFGDPLGSSKPAPNTPVDTTSASAQAPISRWMPNPSADSEELSAAEVLGILQGRRKATPTRAEGASPVYRFRFVANDSLVYTDSKRIRDWLLADQNKGQVALEGVIVRVIR